MNKTNKILLLSIIIVVVLIIIFVLSLLLLSNSNNDKSQLNNIVTNQVNPNIENNTINNSSEINQNQLSNEELNNIKQEYLNKLKYEDIVEEEKSKLKHVEDKTQYFTIKTLYSNYITLAKNRKKENLINILANDYIVKNEINESNIIDELDFSRKISSQNYELIIMEMLLAQLDDTYKVFIVKGNARIIKTNEIIGINTIIKMNTIDKRYEIYPDKFITDNKYDLLKAGDSITFSTKNIAKNDSNKFSYLIKEEYDVAEEYFNRYKELINYYPNIAYNMLDEEYSSSRFANYDLYNDLLEIDIENTDIEEIDAMLLKMEAQQVIEMKKNYNTYLEENKKRLSLLKAEEYKMSKGKDYIDYIVIDKYDNTMTFRKKDSFLNYVVKLDNNSEFSSKKTIEEKIVIIQNMINTKDYSELYDILDSKFKTNYFPELDNLKEYIKQNFYEINEITAVNVTEEEYYICECKVVNSLNRKQFKNITIKTDNKNISFSLENEE